MTPTDSALEVEIDAAYERLVNAESEAQATLHWNAMVVLIRQRSAERIVEMEIERRIGAKYSSLFTYEAVS
jgi:hypothetical protein